MAGLNETPSGNRLHIGVFGKTNSGKSSFINRFSGQNISIVANVAGTTTDPVYKAMEVYPLGPCTLIDTAGFDDATELGEERLEKTRLAAEKTDIAIILLVDTDMDEELEQFKEKKTPVIWVIGKADIRNDTEKINETLYQQTGQRAIVISAATGDGMDQVRKELVRNLPEQYGASSILRELVTKGDLVMLVMPQDIQAPKGRLILPQVQTLRELLDKKCLVMSVTTDQYVEALSHLTEAPKLIITDSQVFAYVYEHKPKKSMLTSFSVLFAAHKGDIEYYIEGANAIGKLNGESHVLIAECCTHAPLKEDIGREKIPKMLRKRYGENMTIDIVSGTDFPDDLQGYDLVIQCGGCMFNRKYIMSRIDHAKEQQIPMTNYGVVIAYLTGILDKVVIPV